MSMMSRIAMIKKEECDKTYFEWLCDLVGANNKKWGYSILMRTLYNTSFVAIVRNDDNREADGLNLRKEYDPIYPEYISPKSDYHQGCSVLEMMIALARSADFMCGEEAGKDTESWFWEMLRNLEITKYTDDILYGTSIEDVKNTLRIFINRRYEKNGIGGLFPLMRPKKDQRRVELWYQLAAYIEENYTVCDTL